LKPTADEESIYFLLWSIKGEVWKISDKFVNFPQYDKSVAEWEKEAQGEEEKDGG
jgi:hypothetical protein